ncbi:MAG: hypothetical protein V7739_08970 [Motiliproteus sp.]
MKLSEVVKFNDSNFFDGAVQVNWIDSRPEMALHAAESYVFHGPQYHGVSKSSDSEYDSQYVLKDSASFLAEFIQKIEVGDKDLDVNPYSLVIAGYGSGKSHLALTLAQLFTAPLSPTSNAILSGLSKVDSQIGEYVSSYFSRSVKPALVITLDGMSGFHLGNAISSEIFRKIGALDLDLEPLRLLSPRFQIAEEFVLRNFEIRKSEFTKLFTIKNVDQIISALRERDEDIYSDVDSIYLNANGSPIPVEGQESIQDLIESVISCYCGDDGPFSHMVILFDEFGRYLEYAAEKPSLAGDSVLQQLFQGVQDNKSKVRFVGFIQYELKAYLKRFSGIGLRQIQRYVTRYDAADKIYLSSNLETIIANMMERDSSKFEEYKRNKFDKAEVLQLHNRLASALPGFSDFSVWGDLQQFSNVIVEGCWPLHPLTVWFLTRQKDIVQSRSALTFIKESVDSESLTDVKEGFQIPVSNFAKNYMLPELLSAERQINGSIFETLNSLLERFESSLSNVETNVLVSIALLDKLRAVFRSKEQVDLLVSDACYSGSELIAKSVSRLEELGALEWNDDLFKYELLSDGASRAQFNLWMKHNVSQFNKSDMSDLFIKRAVTDLSVEPLLTDFGVLNDISTSDWRFDPLLAHANNFKTVISRAFDEWAIEIDPFGSKGRLIYLYLNDEDDVSSVLEGVDKVIAASMKFLTIKKAPIWVVVINDLHGNIGKNIVSLEVIESVTSGADFEKFRRFIVPEKDSCRYKVKDAFSTALKEKTYIFSGCTQIKPLDRMKKIGGAIFSEVYPSVVPFNFDGFSNARGGGSADCITITRALISRQLNFPWVQGQIKKLQNRIDSLLIKSWNVFDKKGRISLAQSTVLKDVFTYFETLHKDDPGRTLGDTYKNLISPPYGFNSASASVFLGLLISSDTPDRRLLYSGAAIASPDWLNLAYPQKAGRKEFKVEVLAETTIRFLAEDASSRWRSFLDLWEGTYSKEKLVELHNEALVLQRDDIIPESLEGRLSYLMDKSVIAKSEIDSLDKFFEKLERSVMTVEREGRMGSSVRLLSDILKKEGVMNSEGGWGDSHFSELSDLKSLVITLVKANFDSWVVTQTCNSMETLEEFRRKLEWNVSTLNSANLNKFSKTLRDTGIRSIAQIQVRWEFRQLIIDSEAFCDFPIQDFIHSIQEIRSKISSGKLYSEKILSLKGKIDGKECNQRISNISKRIDELSKVLELQQSKLSSIYEPVEGLLGIEERLVLLRDIRPIFINTRDLSDIDECYAQLLEIKRITFSWVSKDLSPQKIEVLSVSSREKELSEYGAFLEVNDYESLWDAAALWGSILQSRLHVLLKMSSEFIEANVFDSSILTGMSDNELNSIKGSIESEFPLYLSEKDLEQMGFFVDQLTDILDERNEEKRFSDFSCWFQKFSNLDDLQTLSKEKCSSLVSYYESPLVSLKSEELEEVEVLVGKLKARIDSLSTDDIVSRIKAMPFTFQKKIYDKLSKIITSNKDLV